MLIKDYEKYEITEDGKVINTETGRILKPEMIWDGYERVTLSKDGVTKRFRVHRLVAEAFIPNDDPCKDQVNHKDGDRKNNSVDNLEWVTCKENIRHGKRSYGVAHYCAKLTDDIVEEICKLIEIGLTRGRILDKFPFVTKSQFDDIRRRRSWKSVSKNYKW